MNAVNKALDLWIEITNIDPNATTFNLRDLDIININDELKESLKLDETFAMTLMMLDYFVTEYLKIRSFTVSEMLQDFTNVRNYLEKCKELYSLLHSDELNVLRKQFEERVLSALNQAGVNREDVIEMVKDPHCMAFLRRDALRSMKTLGIHQFYQGEPETEELRYVKKVYGCWNINSLIQAMSKPKMSGVSLILIKDPVDTSSYFAFAIRNGGTLTILTDNPEASHPLQKYMSRRPERDFSERIAKHHFPYDLMNLEFDHRGDARVKPSHALVRYQEELTPLKDIRALAPDEIIWIVMMFSLIEKKFYKENFKTEEISYTGEMLKVNNLLALTDALAVTGYKTLEAQPLTSEDVSTDKMLKEWEVSPTQQNRWIEERYEDKIDDTLLNFVGDTDTVRLITSNNDRKDMSIEEYREMEEDIHRRSEFKKLYQLQTLDATCFGTAQEVISNQRWVARYNKAKLLQMEALKEYEATKGKVFDWYAQKVNENAKALLEAVAKGTFETPDMINKTQGFGYEENYQLRNILSVNLEKDFSGSWNYGVKLKGTYREKTDSVGCYVTDKVASIVATFSPSTPEALACLCGCDVKDLPEVLQNWTDDTQYSGNHILDKIDPVEWVVQNPWRQLSFGVAMYLSKTAYNDARKELKLPPNKFWEKS